MVVLIYIEGFFCATRGYNFCSLGAGTLRVRFRPQPWIFLFAWPWDLRWSLHPLWAPACSSTKWGVWTEISSEFSLALLLCSEQLRPRSHLWWGLEKCCVGWRTSLSSLFLRESLAWITWAGFTLYPEAALCFLVLTKAELLWKPVEFPHVLKVDYRFQWH